MAKIGMIILNYNDFITTEKFINQIKNYKVLDKIIIVDNKSSDSSYEKLKKYQNKKINVISTKDNKGYSYGNNYGIKYLNQNENVDYILISNPDIIVEEKDILKLKKDLDENDDISVISPNIYQNGETKRGWKLSSVIDEILLNVNYFHRKIEKKIEYNVNYYTEKLKQVDVVSGCFFLIRKKDFEEINYFDENTFLYYEENILAAKLKKDDKKTYVDTSANVIHNLSVSVNKTFSSINKYKILKKSQRYYVKNYLNANIIQMLFLYLFYLLSLGISYILCLFRWLRSKIK